MQTMIAMTDFFRVLPPRHCAHCNNELMEMADCYATLCQKCDGSVFYPLSPPAVDSTGVRIR